MGGLGVALAEIAHEEFLDGNLTVEPCLHGKIGDAETNLDEQRIDAVLSAL
jgi:hypothetical protein